MAIAYDAVSVGFANPTTSLTFAHTCTGANLVLIVGIKEISAAAESVTGVTYNGVAMTKINARRIGDNARWMSLWYLINPATGANNVVVSLNPTSWVRAHGVSYTGCKQSGQPDASATHIDGAGTADNSALASIADNCWHLFIVGNGGGTQAAGTGTTLRGTASDSNIMDSNSAKTPAGSVTLQATYGSNTYWGDVIASLAPYVAAGGLSIPVAQHHYKMMRS